MKIFFHILLIWITALNLYGQNISKNCSILDGEVNPDPIVFMRFETGFDGDHVRLLIDDVLISDILSMDTVTEFGVTGIILLVDVVRPSEYCIKLFSNDPNQPSWARLIINNNLKSNILYISFIVNNKKIHRVIDLAQGKFLYFHKKRRNKLVIDQQKRLIRLE